MSSRRLLTAVVLTAAAFGLAGCGPDNAAGTSAGSSTGTAAAAPQASAPVAAAPGAGTSKAAVPGGTASDAPGAGAEPGTDCTPGKPAAGHRIVQPVKQPTQDTMYAKATKFVCDPNDGHWEATGGETAYHFAPKVKAQLVTDAVTYRTVPLPDLWTHIGDCLAGGQAVKPPLTCSAFPVYDIVQDSTGKITEIKEIWHS
ncbi:hypothetical protein [Saccharothrix sp. ST-888]|uniref:hypothetical protein n=1 Tax=Saccharothrix sp. ST-888 TaxID=1427391 RepID=UPI0005EC14C1|nr:hypothetical protein [Saccharothrix sp. ST-888]KJK56338.1 hypothetical protein UK12_23150 [Saccharothrix sp. ST-888]